MVMKPPNVAPPPTATPDQTTSVPNASQQQSSPIQNTQPQQVMSQPSQLQQHQQPSTPTTTSSNTISLQRQQLVPTHIIKDTSSQGPTVTQPIITTQAIVVLKTAPNLSQSHEQQAPLALTTQPQNKTLVQTTSAMPQIHQQQQQHLQQPTIISAVTATPTNTITLQHQVTASHTVKDNNLNRSNIQPQALITTQANIKTITTTIGSQHEQQAPLALITQPQSKPSFQATSSPTPMAGPLIPPQAQANVVPTPVKQEQNKLVCCLLDHGAKCERVAGNASFSARIQKIVASKKMNFALDTLVRHAYICDHHKAVITVAKKSIPTARESKAAARNLAAAAALANNTTITDANAMPTHMNNYESYVTNQPTLQGPVNLEMMQNQGRIANNHTGMLISMPIRPGTQIAYGHYGPGPGAHMNQLGRLDHPMMNSGSYDNTGGDNDANPGSSGPEVDLQQLQVNTLRRYKRHFRVPTRPGLNKMQLAESLKHHFRTLPIIEKEAITYFVYIVKSSRNKLDHNPKAD